MDGPSGRRWATARPRHRHHLDARLGAGDPGHPTLERDVSPPLPRPDTLSTGEAFMTPIETTSEWAALAASGNAPVDLRTAFAEDPERASRLTVEAGDLVADLSKHLVTGETISLLVAVARRAGLEERIEAMFGGEH